MAVTRSSTRSQTTAAGAPEPASEPVAKAPLATKRKAPDDGVASESKKKRATPAANKGKAKAAANTADVAPPTGSVPPPDDFKPVVLPAELTFSFDEAKQHLIRADRRFADVFRRLPCKPFERLERVEPFRTLTTSILGQQISWKAARSINHRFIRLYFPHLPEKPDDSFWAKSPDSPFPTPHQVATTEASLLREAGLSGRKVEYVQDLASRFADGRLTSQKLFDASDEELHEMLIAVRGIGRWTVDMFALFSLRRPDIMPVGDLGVQRGIQRWFLSLHHPTYRIEISPEKLPSDPEGKPETSVKVGTSKDAGAVDDDADALPVFGQAKKKPSKSPRTPTPDASILPPVPSGELWRADTAVRDGDPSQSQSQVAATPSVIGLPSMPPAFTPSINQTLEGKTQDDDYVPLPLPEGLTVAALKSRLDGKKKIKGALLTPEEMESLTESWKPYRRVYYMWALAEEK
ncbi:hypothetical protein EVG20_g2993 [Dentipellis fragilis]|uniref:HhH-GPD domain-containing protein n=1 Tax=Dentipellis fragilis TaxID=205917 RepID=A0A4Y9Z7I6_9AGAM|nr:hypothetical protein EVG20_g2993 [Dentipellis fragilis]